MPRQHLAAIACLVLVGCGSGDNDPSGNYRGSVVNRVNGCHFEGWVEDKTMTMVVLSIAKDAGTDWLYAELYGLDPALVLNVLGTVRFEGRVEGDDVKLRLQGTRQLTQNGCTYSVIGNFAGVLEQDTLAGDIQYTVLASSGPDCGELQTCTTLQEFSGTRPAGAP